MADSLRLNLPDNFAARESVPGTFRTWRDVRLESVMRTKADVRRPLQIHGFTPQIERVGGPGDDFDGVRLRASSRCAPWPFSCLEMVLGVRGVDWRKRNPPFANDKEAGYALV